MQYRIVINSSKYNSNRPRSYVNTAESDHQQDKQKHDEDELTSNGNGNNYYDNEDNILLGQDAPSSANFFTCDYNVMETYTLIQRRIVLIIENSKRLGY